VGKAKKENLIKPAKLKGISNDENLERITKFRENVSCCSWEKMEREFLYNSKS